jgi:hypothetical protein
MRVSPKTFVNLLNTWEDSGISYPAKFQRQATGWFGEFYAQLASRAAPQERITRAARAKLPNFWVQEHRATADPKSITPFPVIENGKTWVMLPRGSGFPGTKSAVRATRDLVQWKKHEPRMIWFGTVAQIRETARKLKDSGVFVQNAGTLNKQFRDMKKLKVRVLS